MSGGTSAGNIITEAVGVYGVRTWVFVAKADAFGIISDAQLASIIGANWFNNVDDALIDLNAWMNGTGVAAYLRATEATIATVNSTNVVTTNLNTTAFVAATAVIGSGLLTDGVSTADDLVIGSLAATDRGITILSTTVAQLCFADTAATLTGYVSYTHATDTLSLGVAGSTEVNLTSTVLAPHVDGGLALGTSILRYGAAHANAVTAYTSLTVGDAMGAPVLTLDRDTASDGDVVFAAESVTGWRVRHASAGGLSIDRFDAGVYADSVTFATADGAVGLPTNLTVGGNITMTDDNATITVGSGSNTATLNLDGPAASVAFKDTGVTSFILGSDGTALNIDRYVAGVYADSITVDNSTGALTVPLSLTIGSASAASPLLALNKDNGENAYFVYYNEDVVRWQWWFDTSEDLNLRRYDAGEVYQDAMTISSTSGKWTFPAGIAVSGATNRFTAGAGAPAGGANGDIYWRTGGTRSTCLYYRTAGVWEALLT